jgi:hypothetical protein
METFTAFPQLEHNLKSLVATVDREGFRTQSAPACSSSFCARFGMCCSLVVAVTKEEAETIQAVVSKRPDFFKGSGCIIRGDIFRTEPRTGRRYLRSKRRSFKRLNAMIQDLISEKILDLGAFIKLLRVCVFSMDDGCCALQKLSEAEGRHKWHYKPVNCWKYPLSIADGQLSLGDGHPGAYFPCSKKGTIPAVEGLKEELEFLGEIIGRDLTGEIRGLKR